MRAFVAAEVSGEVKAKIAALQMDMPSGVKRVEVENLHLTLAFLGEISEAKVQEVKKALDSVSAAPFEVKCAGVGVFPSEKFVRVVWMGLQGEGLKSLHETVAEALAPLEFMKERFSPHITIGRLKSRVELREFLQKHQIDEFGSFLVDRIVLKKSTLTSQGPIYETVQERPLKGRV